MTIKIRGKKKFTKKIMRENFPGGNFPGGEFSGGNFPGGVFPGDIFPRIPYLYWFEYLTKGSAF